MMGGLGELRMRQFDYAGANESFRKEQIKCLDKHLNSLIIQRNSVNVQIALLLDKRSKLKKPLTAISDKNNY